MEKQLFDACENGNFEVVKQILTNNPQFNPEFCLGKDNYTPFYISCVRGHTEIMELLLKDERVNINFSDNVHPPLYCACYNVDIETIKVLLANKRIDVNKTGNSATPFWISCSFGLAEVVKLLLDDERVDINKADRNGNTPLYISCFFACVEVVEHILASGKDIRDVNVSIEITRSKVGTQRVGWENEENYEKKIKKYKIILEDLESFERNPIETRTKLRMKLRLAGHFFFFF
mgnify:CR=1 FL=1